MLIPHSLQFVTEIDESHPNATIIQNMPEQYRQIMFEQMLVDLVAPRLQPILDELNANNSWAILRVAD
jgi:hypothetical protein